MSDLLHYEAEYVPGMTPKSNLKDELQSCQSLTNEELQDLISLAVEFENYEAAQRVKEVLEERKSNSYES